MSNLNPLFQNDPVLILIDRWFGLTPLSLFYVTVLALPGVLTAWSAINGTLRVRSTVDNPHGHGLLSPINAYLLIVPYVNYTIFNYYDSYRQQIAGLFASKIIHGSEAQFFRVFSGPVAVGLTAFGYIAALTLCIISLLWKWKIRPESSTTWLLSEGRPRGIAYYFNGVFFIIEMSIVFNWMLRHVIVWYCLNDSLQTARLRLFHPDKMFGLSPLGELASHSFGVVFAISALVAIWLVGARLTHKREALFAQPGHVAALAALVVLGPCAVLLPLTQAHLVMERGKQVALARISGRAVVLSDELEERTGESGNAAEADKTSAALKREADLYQNVVTAETWPIKTRDLGTFPIGFLTPVWIALAGELVKRLAKRYSMAHSATAAK